jgi:hypothetical protein
MQIILHSADISNGVRQFDIAFNWSERIMQEFWDQVINHLIIIKILKGRQRKITWIANKLPL